MNKFSTVFSRIPLTKDVFNELESANVKAVNVDKKLKKLSISMELYKIINERNISEFKSKLHMELPSVKDIDIAFEYVLEGLSKEQLIKMYWKNILSYVETESPVCFKLLEESKWRVKDNALIISVKNNGLFLFLKRGVDKSIQEMINRRLKAGLIVVIENDAKSEAEYGKKQSLIHQDYVEALSNYSFAKVSLPKATIEKQPTAKKPLPNQSKQSKKFVRSNSSAKIVNSILEEAVLLSKELQKDSEIIVSGQIFDIELRETRNGKLLVSFDITDRTSSITIKFFSVKEEYEQTFNSVLKKRNFVKVKGKVQFDEYAKQLNIMAAQICSVTLEHNDRADNYETKRVELHLHTQMSAMDGMNPAKDYISHAAKFGHRAIAITDHAVVQSFPEAMEFGKKLGIKIIYGVEAYLVDDLKESYSQKLKHKHAVILAKNQLGLKHLYELVSKSHINYFYKRPRIPKSEFLKLREGLIIGTACDAGELYSAVLNNLPKEHIDELAQFYDYFEIQPIGNCMYMVRNGRLKGTQDLIDINKKIVELGKLYNKPVVATCDVHFLNPEDEIFRRIIQTGEGYKDAESQPPLYYRTTEEMLLEFEYLGEQAAKQVVIESTNKIADMIEDVKPIPSGTFPPVIEGAEEELVNITMSKAKSLYGETLPEIVAQRLNKELSSITKNGFSVMYIIAQKLVWKSIEDGYLVGSRGSVGSSFVATMAGITEVNPLPPHYLCPKCKFSDFNSEIVKPFAGGSGCDMPKRACPVCGENLKKDGHDIPFETFLGFDGDKEPDIDLNFSGEYQLKAHAYTEELFGEGNVFKAGTIGTLADKTAFGYVMKYFDEKGVKARPAEVNRLKLGCTGIKKTTGQHPGGLIVLPKGHSIYEFCPVQRPANDANSNVVTTHFDFHSSIEGRLLKLDILGHDVPTIIRMLHDITGIDPRTVDLSDKDVLSLFTSMEALNIDKSIIDSKTGSLGLPEFGTSFVRQMLVDTQPTSFSELVRISGLSHGTDVWFNNAQDLIRDNVATLKEIIPTRDDIMVYLINKGVEKLKAFKIMEGVRKGKGVKEEDAEAMKKAGVPEWYTESCRKIKYMFPKGHAVAYVMMTVRIGYYKIHYPYSFYAATFSVRSEDFDYELMCHGVEACKREYTRISELGKEVTAKEKNTLTTLELVLEMYARGLKFVPIDLYKAQAKKFIVTEDGLMPPLITVQGLGESVAENIVNARNEDEFSTIREFRERTKVNKTVLQLLQKTGILDGLPETEQLTLF